ncbi:hypothetical protein ACJA25_02735 [Mycoplasmopsis hyopharyngis]|uniref:hypothetical protein n=1 Tax=Mycoplasmopsis hyopharyngis TaxID=29558 RepID=UPI0038736F67
MKKTKWIAPLILPSILMPVALVSSKCNPETETIDVEKEIKLFYIGSENKESFEKGLIDKNSIKINDLQLEINGEKNKDKYTIKKIMVNFDNENGHLLFQLIDKKTNAKSEIYTKDFPIQKTFELKNFFIETKTNLTSKINEEKIKEIKNFAEKAKANVEKLGAELLKIQNDSSLSLTEKAEKITKLVQEQQKSLKVFVSSNIIAYLFDNIDLFIEKIDDFKNDVSIIPNEKRIEIKKEIGKLVNNLKEAKEITEDTIANAIEDQMLMYFQKTFLETIFYFNKTNYPFFLKAKEKYEQMLEKSKGKTIVFLAFSKECGHCQDFLKYWNEKHKKAFSDDELIAFDINFGTEDEKRDATIITEIIKNKLGVASGSQFNLPFFAVIKDKKIVGNSLFVPNENESWENKLLSQRH